MMEPNGESGAGLSRRTLMRGALAVPAAALAITERRPAAAAPARYAAWALGRPAQSGLKALMTGLTWRGDPTGQKPAPPQADVTSGLIQGVVAYTTWADIEAQGMNGGGQPIAVESALNAAFATGLSVCRLRISMGIGAPPRLIQPSFSYYNPQGASSADMPYWWTPSYLNAAAGLVEMLGSVYDPDPRIADVTFSAPCTFYSEWPIRQLTGTGHQQNVNLLTSIHGRDAYSTDADKTGVVRMSNAYARHFTRTRVTFADSLVWDDLVWDDQSSSWQVTPDNAWFTEFITATRSQSTSLPGVTPMGNQAVHGTNNLDVDVWPQTTPNPPAEIVDVLKLGPPYSYQTRTLGNLTGGGGSLKKLIEQAITYGQVCCIELPADYDSYINPDQTNAVTWPQIHKWNKELAANGTGL